MKTVAVGIAVTAASVGFAIANRADSERARSSHEYPADCVIAVAVAPGYLPRAGLVVENRLDRPVRIWLEGRAGSRLKSADLGTIGAREQRMFAHVLPAGRNVLTGDDGSGRTQRQVLFISNHGSGTCGRRFLWRIG